MGRIGRPRTTECFEEHHGPCRRCAAERARRWRRLHPGKERRYVTEAPTSAALLLHQRADVASARRYLLTYLVRGSIAPPYGCDRCGAMVGDPCRNWIYAEGETLVPLHEPPKTLDMRTNRRLVAWVCRSCRREVRANGGAVDTFWRWPGPTMPRRRRAVHRIDESAHQNAVRSAATLPPKVQARGYCEGYLAAVTAPEAWLGRILRDPKFAPTGLPAFDEAWRRHAESWWDRRRHDAATGDPVGRLHFSPLRPRPQPACVALAPSPTPRRPSAAVKPFDEAKQLAALDAAEDAFDRRVAEIMARLASHEGH